MKVADWRDTLFILFAVVVFDGVKGYWWEIDCSVSKPYPFLILDGCKIHLNVD